MNARLVGIDLGATAMKGGVVGAAGAVERAESRHTARDDALEGLAAFASELAAGGAAAVGVAVPGLVDEASGVARASVNLGWRDVPLRRVLQERLGLPVAVTHDVRAAARAEGAAGAARGRSDWVLVTAGTGVGAAVVAKGAPYAGAHGIGGELGHIVVVPDGPPCACGARGCVEALASAAAVERRYAAASGREVRAEEVIERAGGGDEAATAVWREAVEALAAGLAAAVVMLDPELIVVGGGLAGAGPALFDPLAAELRRRLTFLAAPPVVPAALGTEAGWRGAALLAAELA